MHSDPVSWCKKQISLLFLMPSTLFLPPRHFLTLFSLSRMSTILPIQESHTLQSAFPSFSRTNDKNNNNKKKPRNLFPNHMFGLQLRSLGQRFILHPPWGQRDSQNRLVFCFFFFFFKNLLTKTLKLLVFWVYPLLYILYIFFLNFLIYSMYFLWRNYSQYIWIVILLFLL